MAPPPPTAQTMLTDAPEGPLERVAVAAWSAKYSRAVCDRALDALENGKIVFLSDLAFDLSESERRFLNPAISDGKSKNVSFDPLTGAVGGTSLSGRDREDVAALLSRFAAQSRALLTGLFPHYAAQLELGRSSLRPVGIDNRHLSYRKDDTRLHIDAFPSRPVQGRRILRVFANVNPDGAQRVWRVGEPFADCARRFLPRYSPGLPGTAPLLRALGITKGRRTEYDRLMLGLHDRAKADDEYQRAAIRAELAFPAGSTWIVYTDCVLHAAIAGQHAFEQTFYLPVEAMADPERAPLRILERLAGRPLLH
jgi:hypothetical protein